MKPIARLAADICRERGWKAGDRITRVDPDTGAASFVVITAVGHFEVFGRPVAGLHDTDAIARPRHIKRFDEFELVPPTPKEST